MTSPLRSSQTTAAFRRSCCRPQFNSLCIEIISFPVPVVQQLSAADSLPVFCFNPEAIDGRLSDPKAVLGALKVPAHMGHAATDSNITLFFNEDLQAREITMWSLCAFYARLWTLQCFRQADVNGTINISDGMQASSVSLKRSVLTFLSASVPGGNHLPFRPEQFARGGLCLDLGRRPELRFGETRSELQGATSGLHGCHQPRDGLWSDPVL